MNKKLIGRIEKIDFPSLGLFNIDAKIDTGAYSSAIHCHYILEDVEAGLLYFKLLDPSHTVYNEKKLIVDTYSKTQVKNSMGKKENRYKIKTSIHIGKKEYITNFTLTDRTGMRVPILLGRKVLKGRFLVDASEKYILTLKNI